jgi:uncharacterized protein YuzE
MGEAKVLEFRHDPQVNACYAKLREGKVARTFEVSDSEMIDVDSDGQVLGVEVIGGTDWEDVLVRLAMQGRLVLRDPGQ